MTSRKGLAHAPRSAPLQTARQMQRIGERPMLAKKSCELFPAHIEVKQRDAKPLPSSAKERPAKPSPRPSRTEGHQSSAKPHQTPSATESLPATKSPQPGRMQARRTSDRSPQSGLMQARKRTDWSVRPSNFGERHSVAQAPKLRSALTPQPLVRTFLMRSATSSVT